VTTACQLYCVFVLFPIFLSCQLPVPSSVIINLGGGASIPSLHTSRRIRRGGRKCAERKARNGSEQSASWGAIFSTEGFPQKTVCGGVLCI